MPTPTTLRGELLKSIRTFNDRFFLTLGDKGAGSSPYNPIQLGIGVRFIFQANNSVTNLQAFMSRVVDGESVSPRTVLPIQTNNNTWELEGAIGGDNLGFPQPVPNYYMPQCFELRVEARNRGRVDVRTYTFWVSEGPIGSIAQCVDREVVSGRPCLAGFDGVGWFDLGIPAQDNFSELFIRNQLPPTFATDCEDLINLPADPADGVHVIGLANPINGKTPAVANPWVRTAEPDVENTLLSIYPQSDEFSVVDVGGFSVWAFDVEPTVPTSFLGLHAWQMDADPYLVNSATALLSSVFDTRGYFNFKLKFHLRANLDLADGLKLQVTIDGGTTWVDVPSVDLNVAYDGNSAQLAVDFGGATDCWQVQDFKPPIEIVADLSAYDNKAAVQVRWAFSADAAGGGDTPVVSQIYFQAKRSPSVNMDAEQARLKAGFGDQWKYQVISADEKFQQGRLNMAPTGSPAAVPPTGGSGVPNNLAVNIQVANDIGGAPGGPNIGYPLNTNGPAITLVSDDDLGPSPNDFVINITLPPWLSGGTWDYVVCAGLAADWVGGLNLGGTFLVPVTADLLGSVQAATEFGVPDGGGAWVAGSIVILSMAKGTTKLHTLTQTGSGITWGPLIGQVWAVQIIAWDTLVGAPLIGLGLLGSVFPDGALRSNALRFVIVA